MVWEDRPQEGAVGRHLAQIQHRSRLHGLGRLAVRLVVDGEHHPIRDCQAIHDARDHQPGNLARERHLGTAAGGEGHDERRMAKEGDDACREALSFFTTKAGAAAAKIGARRGEPLRVRQRGQVLQQSVDQGAAPEPLLGRHAAQQRRTRLRYRTK